ncbi:uncharacterized protein LOC126555348 [Aphis gossypii]|uniref:uncharacterized protein LOC126555348 n=1 Tax=Aphis gossypii TaxID=80765 RepID=UPI002158A997|nr:uncharacterized protein LOC126555348 [Aphis gossypii]
MKNQLRETDEKRSAAWSSSYRARSIHSCVVCFTNSKNKTEDISFRLFPTDLSRKNLWIHTLKLNVPISKWHRVCSKHFAKNSYIFSNCRKMLHSNAFLLSHSEIVENDVCNPTKLNYQNSDESVIFGFSPSSSISSKVAKVLFPENPSTSVNMFPSHTKRRKFWNSSRMGDLEKDDFSTPKRRKQNFMMVQRTVSNLRYKNKLLHQKNRRLQKKVESLNEIISVLKTKSMIFDNAAINLKVFSDIVTQTVNNILCCYLLVIIIHYTRRKGHWIVAMGSDVLERIVKESMIGKKSIFGKEIREFAVTLQYYSPRAYS